MFICNCVVQIAIANKVIIPEMVAVKFPDIKVNFSDGKTMKLPIRISDYAVDSDKSSVPKASLVCLSFRAISQVNGSWQGFMSTLLHCLLIQMLPT